MHVTVRFAGSLRDLAGVRGTLIELSAQATTGDALDAIAQQFPGIHRELFGVEPKGYYSIFVNDKLIAETDRQKTALNDGDDMLLVLPIAGGLSF